jgi:hypothetical protein
MKKLILITLLFFNIENTYAKIDSLPKGLDLHISKRYSLEKVSTNLTVAIDVVQDFKTFKMDSHQGDSSLSSFQEFFCLRTHSLVFKEVDYLVTCSWSLLDDSCNVNVEIIELTFDKVSQQQRAWFILNKNMPKFENYMIGFGNYEWFKFNIKIYFLWFRELEKNIEVLHDCSEILYGFVEKFKGRLIKK